MAVQTLNSLDVGSRPPSHEEQVRRKELNGTLDISNTVQQAEVPELATQGTTTNGRHSQSSNPRETTPVLIVGAGPVGLLLALLLAQSQISSTVIEKDETLNDIPRAIGYYGPVHTVFHEAGVYEQIADEGLGCAGYAWRKPLQDDGKGGKTLGPIIAQNYMSERDEDGRYKMGHYTIQLSQSRLAQILLEAAQETGMVKVCWSSELKSLSQDEDGVTATVKSANQLREIHARYLAGCDGSKSAVRKRLGINFSGHSWPERFIATDVLRTPPTIPDIPVHFVVDQAYWGVSTPLEKAMPGVRSLWRYSMAVTDSSLTDEQVMRLSYVDSLLLRQIDGPRPTDHRVIRKSLYRMHQLLASTMHRGRCFLAGDAAHLNNPIGGLGLCTGLLDADALFQTLKIALSSEPELSTQESLRLFQYYSSSRRMVFSRVISPISSENKIRLHGAPVDATEAEDWYFQALRRGDQSELEKLHRPLSEDWRTDMSQWRKC